MTPLLFSFGASLWNLGPGFFSKDPNVLHAEMSANSLSLWAPGSRGTIERLKLGFGECGICRGNYEVLIILGTVLHGPNYGAAFNTVGRGDIEE
jgi:hypothetical protein